MIRRFCVVLLFGLMASLAACGDKEGSWLPAPTGGASSDADASFETEKDVTTQTETTTPETSTATLPPQNPGQLFGYACDLSCVGKFAETLLDLQACIDANATLCSDEMTAAYLHAGEIEDLLKNATEVERAEAIMSVFDQAYSGEDDHPYIANECWKKTVADTTCVAARDASFAHWKAAAQLMSGGVK